MRPPSSASEPAGLFDGVLARGGVRAEVGDRAWLAAMLEVEAALARALATAGLVPVAAAESIAAACGRLDNDTGDLIGDLSVAAASSGNPVGPLVHRLRAAVGADAAPYVHKGATSQDILDTAAMLVARRALGPLLADLGGAAEAAAALASTHRDTPMAARTLLRQAMPTTFGLKAAGWLVAVLDARERLGALREHGLAAQLGGAAGTLSALGERGLDVSAQFARELDLAEATVPWHSNRVRVAELGAALEIAAGVLAKVALDMQLLAQTEVGEVREGGEAGSSSAMPHKHNPVGAMWTRAGAALSRGHASVLLGSLAGEHERGAGAWQSDWEALSGALGATGGAAAALAGALEGLEVDEGRMRENLALTGGLVVTERLALVLAERVGRTAARELVRDASLRASSSGRSLVDELEGVDTGLAPDELRVLLDPTTYLGSAGVFVDRALARYEEEHRARAEA
jgi:3-carboxy-cis,cis-muconate cycloisomerase